MKGKEEKEHDTKCGNIYMHVGVCLMMLVCIHLCLRARKIKIACLCLHVYDQLQDIAYLVSIGDIIWFMGLLPLKEISPESLMWRLNCRGVHNNNLIKV